MIKIKADEELFKEIKRITSQMSSHLPSIMQNNMEFSQSEYIGFWEYYERYINRLDDWMVKTKKHIKGG